MRYSFFLSSGSIAAVPAIIISVRPSVVPSGSVSFSLLRRREQLPESEDGYGLGGSAKRTYWNIENRSDPDVGGVGPLHPPVLERSGPAVEATGTA